MKQVNITNTYLQQKQIYHPEPDVVQQICFSFLNMLNLLNIFSLELSILTFINP